jgi:hypothetical protein
VTRPVCILGISAFYRDSAVACRRDGEIIGGQVRRALYPQEGKIQISRLRRLPIACTRRALDTHAFRRGGTAFAT